MTEQELEWIEELSSLSSKEAIKRVAKERKLSKREVYQKYHVREGMTEE